MARRPNYRRLDDILQGAGSWGTVNCNGRPPARNVEYENEVNIIRTAPTVIFPQNGAVDTAGKVELEYDFAISAVKHSQQPRQIVVPAQCYRLDRDLPEQGPRPGPYRTPTEQFEGLYKPIGRGINGGMGDGRINYTPDPGNPNGGIPNGTGLPERGKLPEVVCEPPHCEWGYSDSRQSLHTYLRATVRLTADLILGFDVFSAPWLPGVRLLIARDSFHAEVSIDTVDEPFDSLESGELEEAIQNYCIDDAKQVLDKIRQKPVLFFTCPQVHAERKLVPELARLFLDDALNDEIKQLIYFEQSGQHDDLSYEVVNGQYLYWKFRLNEDLTNHLI